MSKQGGPPNRWLCAYETQAFSVSKWWHPRAGLECRVHRRASWVRADFLEERQGQAQREGGELSWGRGGPRHGCGRRLSCRYLAGKAELSKNHHKGHLAIVGKQSGSFG